MSLELVWEKASSHSCFRSSPPPPHLHVVQTLLGNAGGSVQYSGTQYERWQLFPRLADLHAVQTLHAKTEDWIRYDMVQHNRTQYNAVILQLVSQGLRISMYFKHWTARRVRGFNTIQWGTVQQTTAGDCSCSFRACTSPCTWDAARQSKPEDSVRYKGVHCNTPQQAVVLPGFGHLSHVLQILQNKAGGSKGYKEIQYNTPQ